MEASTLSPDDRHDSGLHQVHEEEPTSPALQVTADSRSHTPDSLSAADRGPAEFYTSVGVGPHELPWPEGSQFDPELLASGDTRNVVDKYRYWSVEAIKADLDRSRSTLHVAIENWQHDLNIGSIVRTANAFNVAGVHIVGRRNWNRRGAMVTDKYLHLHHHPTAQDFAEWAQASGVTIVGIEQHERSVDLSTYEFPRDCALLLGNEGLGLTEEAITICKSLVTIPQFGSTRSLNASAAGAIAMWAWRASRSQAGDSPFH